MNYYPHHIGDYAAATAHLSWMQDMAYTRLMRLYYQSEKPIPVDINRACTLVRAQSKAERQAVEDVLQEFFTLADDGWHQKRCDEELAHMQKKSEKARNSVGVRWSNRTNSERNTNVDTNVLRTQCEGITTNNQEPIANNQEPKKEKTKATPQAAFVRPDWVPAEAWEGWLTMRKKKRTPNTDYALHCAVKELERLRDTGNDPAEVLDRATARGWTGLYPVVGNKAPSASMIPGERL